MPSRACQCHDPSSLHTIMSTFLSLTCLLFLVLLAGTIAQPGATTTLPPEPEFYPNIQTIGLGYDHVLGNPHSRGVGGDPGFKSKSVFKFTYNKKKLSGDLKYKIPDGVSVRRVNTCSLNSLSREIQGETSYLQDLSDTASFELSVGVGYFGGAFTNSDSYKRVSKKFVCSLYFVLIVVLSLIMILFSVRRQNALFILPLWKTL